MDIVGYEGLYQASDWGNIKSLSYNRTSKERLLKMTDRGDGYLHVSLFKGVEKRTLRVHQLIAITFLGHVPDGTHKIVVDHIDSNKLNNRVDNLQLITQRQNTSKKRSGTSRFIGVSWVGNCNKWKASISINGKVVYLGLFTDELAASEAYQNRLSQL